MSAISRSTTAECPATASFRCPGIEWKVGPTSTVDGRADLNALVVETTLAFRSKGDAPVGVSFNMPGYDEYAKAMEKKKISIWRRCTCNEDPSDPCRTVRHPEVLRRIWALTRPRSFGVPQDDATRPKKGIRASIRSPLAPSLRDSQTTVARRARDHVLRLPGEAARRLRDQFFSR